MQMWGETKTTQRCKTDLHYACQEEVSRVLRVPPSKLEGEFKSPPISMVLEGTKGCEICISF